MTIEEICHSHIDNDGIRVLMFCLPWFHHQFTWRLQPRNQDKAETQRTAMEELGKVTQSKDVSLETKVKIIHTFMLPISTYR